MEISTMMFNMLKLFYQGMSPDAIYFLPKIPAQTLVLTIIFGVVLHMQEWQTCRNYQAAFTSSWNYNFGQNYLGHQGWIHTRHATSSAY